jgi:type II secretory pathway pseudopilin PulG
MRAMQLMQRQCGFSLIEAVVASAVLLLTCTAVGGTLATVLRVERTVRQRSDLEQVLAAESARLTSLPFFVQAQPPQGEAVGELQPTSLLAVVFPHARREFDSPAAYYCDGLAGGTPGSFVTLVDIDGAALRREARFVVGPKTPPEFVTPEALDGWAVWSGRRLPATRVVIALSVRRGDHTASADLVLTALRARVGPPSSPDASGSAGG